jgi:acyl-CoA synthetase (AMP-forming)/AMP-acid ligase II
MGLMTSFIMPLVARTPVAAMSAFDWVARPESILDLIASFGATLCWLPNFAFAHIARMSAQDRRFDVSGVRAFINCSEPCRASTFEEFERVFRPFGLRAEALQACYAMAETVFAVTQSSMSSRWRRLGAIGKGVGGEDIVSSGAPIPGVEIRIRDEQGKEASEGAIGEVTVRSSMCIERYRGAASAATDKEGWYNTGDVGVIVDRELFVVGRKDDVIVTRGKKVFAHEVETALLDVRGLKAGRSCVLGIDDRDAGTLELVVVCELEADADRKQVRRSVSRTMEYGFGVAPSAIHFVEAGWVVKSSSGKIARHANRKKLEDMLARQS